MTFLSKYDEWQRGGSGRSFFQYYLWTWNASRAQSRRWGFDASPAALLFGRPAASVGKVPAYPCVGTLFVSVILRVLDD